MSPRILFSLVVGQMGVLSMVEGMQTAAAQTLTILHTNDIHQAGTRKTAANAINSDVQKRRFALLLHAGYGDISLNGGNTTRSSL